jgi:uncharacterized protein (TIGR03437 family)
MAAFVLSAAIPGVLFAQATGIRVVNAGSLLPDSLSPGTEILIQGSNLNNATITAPDQLNPMTVMAGVAVKIGNVPAGLIFVSPTSVTAVIDPSTPPGPATLTLLSPTINTSASVNIQAAATPGLLTFGGGGGREGAIFNLNNFTTGPFTPTTNGDPTTLSIFATGLDLSVAPTVTMGGLNATVASYGPSSCCAGLQQVNVQIPAALAGAGRVDVLLSSGGRLSNAVEAVILPRPGQGPFAPAAENATRNREIGAIAYVAATGLALVLDEQDDVIRVIDMKQRAVTRTVALPTGAQPFALAVNSGGTQAVVAERGRAKVAVVDIGRGVVITEIPVDSGPGSVSLSGDTVLVANQDSDTVSILSLVRKQVLGAVLVGRSPRSVIIDENSGSAFVANQGSGTISVIDLARRAVTDTISLGANARPQTLRMIAPGTLVATEPNAGVLDVIDVASKIRSTLRNASADLSMLQETGYFVTQAGAETAAPVTLATGTIAIGTGTGLTLDPGARSLAVDTVDRLLLVACQSSGTVAMIDLAGNRLTGTINAVRAEGETAARQDRSDRERAPNTPVITSITPRQAVANSTTQLTVNAANVGGAYDVFFVGQDGTGRDPALAVTSIEPDPGGNQVRITVQVNGAAAKGDHILRIFSSNGESSAAPTANNVLNIQ